MALYSNRHSILTKHDPEDAASTQFERAEGELNIESIPAYSPHAKGQLLAVFMATLLGVGVAGDADLALGLFADDGGRLVQRFPRRGP